jgi:hypothetical protein
LEANVASAGYCKLLQPIARYCKHCIASCCIAINCKPLGLLQASPYRELLQAIAAIKSYCVARYRSLYANYCMLPQAIAFQAIAYYCKLLRAIASYCNQLQATNTIASHYDYCKLCKLLLLCTIASFCMLFQAIALQASASHCGYASY